MRLVLRFKILQTFKQPDLITVTLVIFDWSMVAVHLREGLKFVSTMPGVLCVVTVSVVMMPKLPVDNLETSQVQLPFCTNIAV